MNWKEMNQVDKMKSFRTFIQGLLVFLLVQHLRNCHSNTLFCISPVIYNNWAHEEVSLPFLGTINLLAKGRTVGNLEAIKDIIILLIDTWNAFVDSGRFDLRDTFIKASLDSRKTHQGPLRWSHLRQTVTKLEKTWICQKHNWLSWIQGICCFSVIGGRKWAAAAVAWYGQFNHLRLEYTKYLTVWRFYKT